MTDQKFLDFLDTIQGKLPYSILELAYQEITNQLLNSD